MIDDMAIRDTSANTQSLHPLITPSRHRIGGPLP
jgi:hypothetical protein